ncbi:MAG: DNA polymerase III subunit gamma/tau [Bacteroidales bacterium]|nr:DNA polymerase III subunit gamma/tau [Bacteroidales bacterium]
MEKFIVSARKYRPATFGTLIGQDSIATTLKNSIKRGQLAHAYLFCGPRGVGKTTTARIFAKIINCMNPGEDMEPCGQCESCKSFEEGRSYCIHELDAASNNSVDDIRALTEKVMIPPQIGKYSVYIIDEVHMLSTSAFNAFLKTLEEPPAHAIFILATTEKHKIIPTILSRCQVYDFNRISIPDIVKNLKMIAEKEEVTIDDGSLHVIAEKADGAMRDALTLFDQVVAYCGSTVDYASVIKNLNVLDYEYYFKLIDNSLEGRFADSLVLFDEVLSKGFNALYFVGGLGNHLRNLLICKETASAKLLEVSPQLEAEYRRQSQRCPLKFLFKALAVTEKCESDYARSNNQRLLVEFMLVRMSQLLEPAARPAPAERPAEPVPAPAPAPKPEPKPEPVQAPAPEPEPQPEPVKPAEPAPEPEPQPEPVKPVEPEPAPEQEKPAEPEPEKPTEPEKPAEPEPAPEAASLFSEPEKPEEKPAEPESTPEAEKPAEPEPASEPVAEPKPEPEKPAPAFAPGLSISGLMNEKKEEEPAEKKPLDFMGPSTGKPVTQEAVDAAWNRMVAMYEQKNPKLVRFIAMLKEAHPAFDQESGTISFCVSNSSQKTWIEQQTGNQMAAFLRKVLENENVKLAVKIKSREDIVKKMYMPQDKDRYLTETNPEFAQLKKDMGAELK